MRRHGGSSNPAVLPSIGRLDGDADGLGVFSVHRGGGRHGSAPRQVVLLSCRVHHVESAALCDTRFALLKRRGSEIARERQKGLRKPRRINSKKNSYAR